MEKLSIGASNNFCPQTLFLYGTYKEDSTPNFGLFDWVSYYWGEELGVMAAICENKLTRDRIRANGVFSMGLVTEEMLPLADYFGNHSGYDTKKTDMTKSVESGRVLKVPVLEICPWTFELEVGKTFIDGEVNVYLCRIRNVLADKMLCDENISHEEKLKQLRPACTVGGTYFSWAGDSIGKWGEPMKNL